MNKFLLVGEKFMLEMHLKQPGFTYSACGLFTKNKERIEKFMQTGNINFICTNELDEACFQHDMVMANQKIYKKKISQIKFWEIKHIEWWVIQNMMVIKEDLHWWFTSFLSSARGIVNEPNYQLANDLHKPINRKFVHLLETIFGVLV